MPVRIDHRRIMPLVCSPIYSPLLTSQKQKQDDLLTPVHMSASDYLNASLTGLAVLPAPVRAC